MKIYMNKSCISILLCSVFFISLLSCSNNKSIQDSYWHDSKYTDDYELIRMDTLTIIQKDSSFITSVINVSSWKDYIFIEDWKMGKLWILNDKLQLLGSIGKKGKSPEEFSVTVTPVGLGDSLYVFDTGALKANIYDSTLRYIGTLPVPPNINPKMGRKRLSKT